VNVVDSSGWLEYFADGPGADFFAPVIERPQRLVVPALTLYEVFKRIHQQRGPSPAFEAVAVMQQGRVVDLGAELAIAAAHLATERRLALADSIIYATARAAGATLWTQDADFAGMPDVRLLSSR
jgi:predicted nucleic acid-binding protein